jgi:diaminopimelate decarboxylase
MATMESWYKRLPIAFLDACVTPCYIYDPTVVVKRWRALRELLNTPLIVSLKANSNKALYSACASSFSDGVELSSPGEIEVLRATSHVPTRIYLNNPSLPASAMNLAADAGYTLIVDGLHQAHNLCRLKKSARPESVMLRLNGAELEAFGLPCKTNHFGMTFDQLLECGQLLSAHGITIEGVHMFRGSMSFWSKPWSVSKFDERLAQVCSQLGGDVKTLNLGGGFPADWERHSEDIQAYADVISLLNERWQVMHEAGRAIFSRAGAFVVRVLGVKRLGKTYFVMCDGGMAQNFLLARTESVYKHFEAPYLIPVDGNVKGAGRESMDVYFVGNSCNREDVIGHWPMSNIVPKSGDYLVFPGCGAYNSSYTVKDFLLLGGADSFLAPAA